MKLKLPDGKEIYLDETLDKYERLELIDNLLNKTFKMDDKTFTLESYFRETWFKEKTIVCMDIIGYYLSKDFSKKSNNDKEVLSRNKFKKMVRGDKNVKIFSDLSHQDQVILGIDEQKDGIKSDDSS
jgi:hypothetical protein